MTDKTNDSLKEPYEPSEALFLRNLLIEKDKIIKNLGSELQMISLENQKIQIELKQRDLVVEEQEKEICRLKKKLGSHNKDKKRGTKNKFSIIKEQYPMSKYSYLHRNK